MSTQQEDGGPAFPTAPTDMKCGTFGMTLRDWFAGMAMSGILGSDLDATTVSETVATIAYHQADAMLAAREPSVEESEWVPWSGGECPVDDECTVIVKLSDGTLCEPDLACHFVWTHADQKYCDNIIAYRIGGRP
jgi:hypothetical protein